MFAILLIATSTTAPPLEAIDVVDTPEAARDAADPTATVTRIDEARMARARERGEALAPLLDAVAGARVLDLGGPGQPQHLSVRGGAPNQALVIVDGIPLESPFATGLDVGLVDAESVLHAELVRGGAGAAYGSGALTGALLVTTRPAALDDSGAVSLSLGSFETVAVRGSASLAPVRVTGSFERSGGAFPYTSDLIGLPDVDRVRENNDSTRGTAAARLDHLLGEGTITLLAGGSFREAGVAGRETQANALAREKRGTGRFRFSWRRPRKHDAIGLEIGGQTALLGIDYEDPLGAPSTTRFYTAGADLGFSLAPADAHLLTLGFAFEAESSDSSLHGTPSRGRGSASAGWEASLDPFVLFAALRAEVVTSAGPGVLPRAGVRWDLPARSSVSLAIGGSYRVPALDELYHPPERGLEGNPSLVPERAWEVEASASTLALDPVRVSVAAFGRTVEDTILYVNRNAFVVRPENLGPSRAAGAELEVAYEAALGGVGLGGSLSGALLHAVQADTGRRLPTQPLATLDAELEVSPRAWLETFTRVRCVSPTPISLGGDEESNAYLRWDAGATVRPVEEAALSVLVTNLLDDRELETLHKIPVPGRTFLATLRVSTEAE